MNLDLFTDRGQEHRAAASSQDIPSEPGPQAAAPAFVARAEEIPMEAASAAHRGTSFTPEKRARQEQEAYAHHLNSVFASLSTLARSPEAHALLTEEMERYRAGYRRRYLAYLAARSRTLSPMITGPSRFPTQRNEKAFRTERRRFDELQEWSARARTAIRRKVAPEEPWAISSDDPDAPERLASRVAKLEAEQEMMKAANRVIRRHKAAESAVPELVVLGLPEHVARKLLERDSAGRIGFADYQLKNNGAEIRRLSARIEELSARRADESQEWCVSVAGVGDVRVVDNVDDNRVQLFFDGKPPESLRAALKSRGFRWAPSIGAWQRHRSRDAREAVKKVLGAFQA